LGCGRGWSRTLLRRPHRVSCLMRSVLSPSRRLSERPFFASFLWRDKKGAKGLSRPPPRDIPPGRGILPRIPVPRFRETGTCIPRPMIPPPPCSVYVPPLFLRCSSYIPSMILQTPIQKKQPMSQKFIQFHHIPCVLTYNEPCMGHGYIRRNRSTDL
jgi:hypothetical protein